VHGIVQVKLSLMTMLVVCIVSWVIFFYHTVPYYVTMLNAVILIIYLTLMDMLNIYQPRASAQLLAPFRSPLVNSLVACMAGLNMLHHIRKSQFWHNLWLQCGRPQTGVVSDVMHRTRADYHRAIRYIKKNEQDIVNARFAAGLLNNNSRDFWSEVKRIRHNNGCFSNCVDSYSTLADIANLFAEKYQELYTSVAYKTEDMESLKNRIGNMVFSAGFNDDCKVRYEEVVFAICKLKAGKNDGDIGLSSISCMHVASCLFIFRCFLRVC